MDRPRMTPTIGIRATLLAFALLCLPALSHAQDQNFRVSFGAGATVGAIDGELSLGGSFGYRFSKFFSFDVDVVGAFGAADNFDERLLAASDGRELGIGRV